MKVEENRQISLTDEYFDTEIKLTELYKKIVKIGRNIHFARTTVTIAQDQYRHSKKVYSLLVEAHSDLTLSLSWLGDALYTISKELPNKEDTDYWKLRDMLNFPSSTDKVNFNTLASSMLRYRKELFRLLDEYHSYIEDTGVLMAIFEVMIEEVRNSVKLLNKIKFYEY